MSITGKKVGNNLRKWRRTCSFPINIILNTVCVRLMWIFEITICSRTAKMTVIQPANQMKKKDN